MNKASESITRMLRQWRDGDEEALTQLMPVIYDDLRRLARMELKRDRAGHSLQPTELVHDAYARMLDLELSWQDRLHFRRMVGITMRRVLIDHARARRTEKRGGDVVKVTLSEINGQPLAPATDMVDLHEALERLSATEPRLGQAIELCYFGGMSYAEIAECLGISRATVDRDLRFARAWLRRALASASESGDVGDGDG